MIDEKTYFKNIRIERVCGEKDRHKLFLWDGPNECFVSATHQDLVNILKLLTSYLGGEPKPEPKEDPRHDSVYQRLEALEKFQKHIERQMQACLKDLNGGMQPGDMVSISSRVTELERNKADAATLSGKSGDKIRDDFRELARLFCNLENSVKALEEQHREITPDAAKYICIDLGYPFKKIYVEKPSEK